VAIWSKVVASAMNIVWVRRLPAAASNAPGQETA
jgi:hypothetical protein